MKNIRANSKILQYSYHLNMLVDEYKISVVRFQEFGNDREYTKGNEENKQGDRYVEMYFFGFVFLVH